MWFVVFFSICLNCIAIGSTQTATAIFNITAPALDISYVSVILAHQIYKSKVKFIEGPFTLGKWGTPINIVAIGWVLFISTVLFFPPQVPVTTANMYVSFDFLHTLTVLGGMSSKQMIIGTMLFALRPSLRPLH